MIFLKSQNKFILNSDSLPNKLNNLIGYFLHGLKLKSYIFEKYKTKKNKTKNIYFSNWKKYPIKKRSNKI